MTSTESLPQKSLKPWLVKPLGWMVTSLKFLVRFVPLIWATSAIYWSNLPWYGARLVLALAFLAYGIYALWVKPNRRTLLVFAGAVSCGVRLVSLHSAFAQSQLAAGGGSDAAGDHRR